LSGALRYSAGNVVEVERPAKCGHALGCGCRDLGIECCLACPRKVCRWEEPTGSARMADIARRDEEIRRLHDEDGWIVSELVAKFDVSKRTVSRVLAAGRGVHV